MKETTIENQPLLAKKHSPFWDFCSNHKMKIATPLAVFNGALYFAIAAAGGKNIERIFHVEGVAAEITIDILGAGASLCYAMFFYKTLESLSLLPKNVVEGTLVFLAPFAASSYLSAGIEGAQTLSFITPQVATTVGIILFILRMVSCADGSIKFPGRLSEMQSSWKKAWKEKNFVELTRLIVTGLTSLGFAACATDSIYSSAEKILGLFNIGPSTLVEAFYYISSVLGAVGILPMVLYWTHRGLKQLTYGGSIDENGKNPDPTDRYTYASLPIVLTVIIGSIGATTGTIGNVFGRLGSFTDYVRIVAPAMYATCSATPGISTLFRGIFKKQEIDPRRQFGNISLEIQGESLPVDTTPKSVLI